jgi:hypothetical protein
MMCFPFVNSVNYIFRVFFAYSATTIETSIDPLIVDIIVHHPKAYPSLFIIFLTSLIFAVLDIILLI